MNFASAISAASKPEEAMSEAKACLDARYPAGCEHVRGLVVEGAWCDWFLGELPGFDWTLLLTRHDDWWLLALTDTD